ncbi:MAG: ABC transporter permease [Anaerolineales bacterium]|nr:ABC transporter permease [Anaerolineales bacterium]
MNKVWLIAINEYKKNVFKKSFILVLLSVPLFIGLSVGMGLIIESLEEDDNPIGYVDHSGVLENPIPGPVEENKDPIEIIAFGSEQEAQQSLESNEIQAYFVIQQDYVQTLNAELVYVKEPGRRATQQFYDFLQTNLLSDLPIEQAHLLALGSDMTIRTPDGSREFPEGGPPLGITIPLLISITFVILLLTSSGYLMDGIVQERENRTMEVIMTSVSSNQMVFGKVIGIVGINFTQLAVWILFAILASLLGGEVFEMAWFQNVEVDWRGLFMVVAIAIPSYLIAAALMFTVGSMVAQAQDAQAVGPLVFITFMLPMYAILPIGNEPNGSIAVLMSLIPFTSLTTIALRNLLIAIPIWQFLLSFVIQTLIATFALWLASQAFRLGMLRYGQRIRLGEIFRRNRNKNKITAQEVTS